MEPKVIVCSWMCDECGTEVYVMGGTPDDPPLNWTGDKFECYCEKCSSNEGIEILLSE